MNIFKNKQFKPHMIMLLLTFIWWGITFITDMKIFTKDPLNMCSLPMDWSMTTTMHILCKILVLFAIFGIVEFLYHAWQKKAILFTFIGFFAFYVLLLLLSYPGYFMSDDVIIFSYATRYLPVYWHNYLTSLYYMVGMSLFPASTGPILLNDLVLAMTFSYIFEQCNTLFSTRFKKLILLAGLCPFVLLSALMCFRPALYSPAFLFFFAYLYFEKKKQAKLTAWKLIMLAGLLSILCFWRSEGIILLPFCFFLIPICYGLQVKKLAILLLTFVIFFVTIRIPQSMGEKKYYGSDYLIISTIRPLSLIIHREQTYEGADADWENIAKVVDLGYLHYETLSCSSYNRYNADINAGSFTQTMKDEKTQRAYLKSSANLILHNLDLYAAERLQLFFVANEIYDYNDKLVMGLSPVETANFASYATDRAYGYELVYGNARIPFVAKPVVPNFLFDHGGEAYLPILILTLIATIYSLFSKKWFAFFSFLSLLGREAVIFLSAPAAFIQYSYPTMFVASFLLLMALCNAFESGFFERKFFRKDKNPVSKSS